VVVLIGMFALYRCTVIVLEAHGLQQWAPFANGLWLAVCAYTWVAPSLFARALKRELEQVALKPTF
jgi:hypothetical protein